MARILPIAAAVVALGFSCTCHRLPEWKGEVDISPIERAAIEACGNGELTALGGKRLHRSPYLQNVQQDSAIVAFAAWPGDIRVELTRPDGGPTQVARPRYAGDPTRRDERLAFRDSKPQRVPADMLYLQAVRFDELESDQLYCYQLISDQGPLTARAPLLTAAPPGSDPIEFVVIGDSGSGSPAATAIAQRLGEHNFDFMLFLGDIAYDSGQPRELQTRFFELYRDYLRIVPAFPSPGNHEKRTRDGAPYFEAFLLPGRERYYSFDWGDVHIVSLDTTNLDLRQMRWLRDDLARNRQRWTIVFGHHPAYSNAFRGSVHRVRRQLRSLFELHGVDLYLAGHEHMYERFPAAGGTHFVVSGGGGGRLTKPFRQRRTVAQATVHHFLHFEVSADRLLMRVIDIEGDEIDRLELNGTGAAETASRP